MWAADRVLIGSTIDSSVWHLAPGSDTETHTNAYIYPVWLTLHITYTMTIIYTKT